MDDWRVQFYKQLKPAQQLVFYYACQGYSRSTVGEQLYITPATVSSHLNVIYQELSNVTGETKIDQRRLVYYFSNFFTAYPMLTPVFS